MRMIWYLLSALCVVFGLLCLVTPRTVHRLNAALNRSVTSLNDVLTRHPRLLGAALLAVSVLFFRLARLLSS